MNEPLIMGRNRVMSDVVLVLPSILKNIHEINLILGNKKIKLLSTIKLNE